MIEQVRIVENWQTRGHVVVILGRSHPGAPRAWLKPDGQWEPLREDAYSTDVGDMGIVLPKGALDALVHEHMKTSAPNDATERHLLDAVAVRDRLLAIVENPR